MNYKLGLAFLLALLTTAVHIFVGTPEIFQPLMTSNMSLDIRLMLFTCWHAVSLLLGISAVFYYLAIKTTYISNLTINLISGIWVAFGLIFLMATALYGNADVFWLLPQWTILIPVGLFGLWGKVKDYA